MPISGTPKYWFNICNVDSVMQTYANRDVLNCIDAGYILLIWPLCRLLSTVFHFME